MAMEPIVKSSIKLMVFLNVKKLKESAQNMSHPNKEEIGDAKAKA